MRADTLLIEHHGVLRALLRQLTSTSPNPTQRRQLLDRLVLELGLHTQIEDEIFYPAARAVSPLVGTAHAEHRQIDDQLAVIMRTDPASADFHTEAQALADTIEHHASEEERDMFPQSHALGEAELERLGTQMATRLDQLRHSAVTTMRLRAKRTALRHL